MINASEIQRKLRRVADGNLSVDAFEDWFVPASWSIRSDSGTDLLELVASVHSLFSLRDDGAFDARALRRELAGLVALTRQNVWLSANVPVRVTLQFDPMPQPCIIKSGATQSFHRFEPALAEL